MAKSETPTADVLAPEVTFDFETWLSGATQVTRDYPMCLDQDLAHRLNTAEERFKEAHATPDINDDRFGWKPAEPEPPADLVALREQVKAKTVTLKLRSLTMDEFQSIGRQYPPIPHGKADDQDASNAAWNAHCVAKVATQIAAPTMTMDQVEQMRQRIPGQLFMELYAACEQINSVHASPDVPS